MHNAADPQITSINAVLTADHRRLDKIIADVCRSVEEGELERAEHTYQEYMEGLLRHIRVEEDLLFVALGRTVPPPTGPIAVMLHEHVLIQDALRRMATALLSGDASAFFDARGDLESVLGPHDQKEERILYPLADRTLGDTDKAEIVRAIR